ncbi:MAG: rhamnogalacturonan acetylesterase [Proteiniphilum sp.]
MIQYKKSGKAAFAMCLLFILSTGMTLFAEERKFYFGDGSKDGFVKVTPDLVYGEKSCWGYDLQTKPEGNNPFFFSVDLPEGSYRVTLLLGNEHHATSTTVRSESRRLMLENVETAAGEFISRSFTVNIRNIRIDATRSVRIKPREVGKLNWDDKLTLEINGKNPGVREMIIRSVDLPTIFLAGNSTVTDQDNEPWCGWGQMLPRFLNEDVVVANYAESGEAGNSFISAGRFDKILTQMKEGDYLFIEFGHNDQKQKGADRGPYTSYKQSLKQMIEGTRARGGTPVLVTPMHRRRFDETGKIINTLGDYPDAVRQLAAEEHVLLIDLNEMSKTLYEAWGPEESKKAFVHYPAGTFSGQNEALEDNTHFNTFGANQICKCMLRGIQKSDSPLKEFIVTEFDTFDPAHPDKADDFYIPPTPFYSLTKPEGN